MRTSRLALSTVLAAMAASLLATTAAEADSSTRRGDAFDVTIKPSTTELVSGKKLTIEGKAQPAEKGAKVVLQEKKGTKPWKREARTTLDRKGRYAFAVKPASTVQRKYRVVVPATDKHGRGTSDAVMVTIYVWNGLMRLGSRSSDSVSMATVRMDGVDYFDSALAFFTEERNASAIDWNLERRCIKLRGTFGMDDTVDDGAAATIDVVADGATIHSQVVTFPSAVPAVLDIRNVFRLGFTFTGQTVDARPGVGTPQVLCAF